MTYYISDIYNIGNENSGRYRKGSGKFPRAWLAEHGISLSKFRSMNGEQQSKVKRKYKQNGEDSGSSSSSARTAQRISKAAERAAKKYEAKEARKQYNEEAKRVKKQIDDIMRDNRLTWDQKLSNKVYNAVINAHNRKAVAKGKDLWSWGVPTASRPTGAMRSFLNRGAFASYYDGTRGNALYGGTKPAGSGRVDKNAPPDPYAFDLLRSRKYKYSR